MDEIYVEKQAMKLLWIIAPILIVITTPFFLGIGYDKKTLVLSMMIAGIVYILVLALLGMLTIRITANELVWSFGFFSRPRWHIPFSEIVQIEVTQSKWIEGWGIKLTREGWLYNAHGFGAVRITKGDGTKLRLGSSDPQRLASFLLTKISNTSVQRLQKQSGQPR
jgi:hypothetical protein